MKTEINLRTREFVIAREFYWPRVIRIIVCILALTALAAGCIYLYFVNHILEKNMAYLEVRAEELKQKVIPLEEMEIEIQALQERAAIQEQLIERITPFSCYLEEIESAAVSGGLNLDSITIDSSGKAVLNGHGTTMEEIARYVQGLNRKPFISAAWYTGMRLESNGGYAFIVEASLIVGGGLD